MDERDAARKVYFELLAKDNLTKDEDDYAQVLNLIINDYEEKFESISGRDRLTRLLDQSKLTQKEFATKVGLSMTTLNNILNGRRKITARARKILADHFNMKEGAFI